MLLLLDRHELTVSELCAILQLPQSTVSRHLKTLGDAGWVVSRREGTSRYYTLSLDERGRADAAAVVAAARAGQRHAGADHDAWRLKEVLARRRSTSQEFFASAAGQWDELREELFGAASHLAGAAGAARRADRGSATSAAAPGRWPRRSRRSWRGSSPSIAPAEMLQAARRRLRQASTTSKCGAASSRRCRSTTASSTRRRCCSCCIMSPIRAAALAEAARVLKPGGRLLIADMLPHDREEYRQQMGHVWLGFSGDQLGGLLGAAGFGRVRIVPLAARGGRQRAGAVRRHGSQTHRTIGPSGIHRSTEGIAG